MSVQRQNNTSQDSAAVRPANPTPNPSNEKNELTPESPTLKSGGPKPLNKKAVTEFMQAAMTPDQHSNQPSPRAISQARLMRNITTHFQNNPGSALVIGLIQNNNGNTNRANLQYQRMLTNLNQLSPAQRSILSQMDSTSQANVLNMNPSRLRTAINRFSAQSQLNNPNQLNLSNELTAQLSAMYNPNDINMMNFVATQAAIEAAEEEIQVEDQQEDNEKTAELEKEATVETTLEKSHTPEPEPKPESTAELEKEAQEFSIFDKSKTLEPQPDHKSLLEKVKELVLSPKTEVTAGLEEAHRVSTASPMQTSMGD